MTKNNFYKPFAIFTMLFMLFGLIAVIGNAGCGGGGSTTSDNTAPTVDTSPVVSVISGYVYAKLTSVSSPVRQVEPVINNAIVVSKNLAAPPGYVALGNAVVQLENSTKATLTNNSGYFTFNITQNDNINGIRGITVVSTTGNVSLRFEVDIKPSKNVLLQVEMNTTNGDMEIKEVNTAPITADFIWIMGKVTSTNGSLPGATVTVINAANPALQYSTTTDVNGYYSFTGLLDGTWNVRVSKADYKSKETNVFLSEGYSFTNRDFLLAGTFDLNSVLATRIGGDTATIEWITSVPSTSQVEYGNTAAYGSVSPLSNLLVNTHSVILNTLSINSTYHYRCRSLDKSNNSVVSSDYVFSTTDGSTQDTDAPVINTWDFTKSHNSFTVVFTMNKTAYGRVEFGLSNANLTATNLQGPSSTITISVQGLTPNTAYFVDVIGINVNDSSKITRQSVGPITTDATPDETAPSISSVVVSDLTPNSLTLTWVTNEKSNSQVYYDFVPASAGKLLKDYNPLSSLQDVAPQVTLHVVKLTNLQMGKTYYLLPVSLDSAENVGQAATETVVTMPLPGTVVNVAPSAENPVAGDFAVGEELAIFRMKITGSSTEAVSLTNLKFKESGTASSVDFESATLNWDAWSYTGTIAADSINFDLSNKTIEIELDGETFVDVYVKMKTTGLDKTVLLSLNLAKDITGIGTTYGQAIGASNAFPLSANTQTIRKGLLNLAVGTSATSETTLNTNRSEVVLLEFVLTAQYENAYIHTIRAEQFGDATTNDFNNVRLFYGIQPLASAPPSNSLQEFSSTATQGMITIPKGESRTLTVVANIPSGASQGKIIQMRVRPSILAGKGNYSNLALTISGSDIYGHRYTLGESKLAVRNSTDSPTSQTYITGTSSKELFGFTIDAGGAEDVNVTSIKITQNGTAATSELANFHLVSDGLTIASATFTNPETTFSNAAGILYIPKGTSKNVMVVADVSAPSGRTILLTLKSAGDIIGTGVSSTQTLNSTGTVTGSSHVVTGKLQTLSSAGSPSGVLVIGAQNTNLFEFQAISTGEGVKYKYVTVALSGEPTLVSNLKLTDGTTTWTSPTSTNTGTRFDINEEASSASITPITFTLSGDVTTDSQWSNSTFTWSLPEAGVTAVGSSSIVTFNSIGLVTGNTLSLTMGSLSLATDNTIVVPSTISAGTPNSTLGSFSLGAGAGENVVVTSITMNELLGSLVYGATGDINSLSITDGTITRSAVQEGANYTFDLSATPVTITAGTSKIFTLSGAIPGSAINNKIGQFGIPSGTKIVAQGVSSGLTIAVSGTATSTPFTLKTGSLTVSANASNPPSTDYPANTATDIELLRFNVTASSIEDIALSQARFIDKSTASTIPIIDPTSYVLSFYTSAGVAIPPTFSGASVSVDSTIINVDLSANKPTITAGDYIEGRITAKFNAGLTVGETNQPSAHIDMLSSDPAMGSGATSGQTFTATGLATGNNMRLTTVVDAVAPVISAVTATNITKNTADISWTTDEPTNSRVYYNKNGSTAWGEMSAEYDTNTRVTSHNIRLTGLTYAQLYDYKVVSVDKAGNSSESAGSDQFTTLTQTLGTLTLALATDNPAIDAAVLANTSKEFLKFTMTAANESVLVDSIKFTNTGTTLDSDYNALTLTSGTATWTASVSGTTITFNTKSPQLTITTENASTLTLSGTAKPEAASKTAIFSIAVVGDVSAKGATTTTAITPTGTPTGNQMSYVEGGVTVAVVNAPTTGIPVLPGQSDQELLIFRLTTNTNEDVRLSKVTISQLLNASLSTDITNLRLLQNTTNLASAAISASNATFGETGVNLFTMAKNTSTDLILVGDISAAAVPGRQFSFFLDMTNLFTTGLSTTTDFTATGVNVTGNTYIIGSSKLQTKLASSSPTPTVYRPDNITGSTFATFNILTGSSEELTTQTITIYPEGSIDPATDLANVKLYDGSLYHNLTYAAGAPNTYTTTDNIVLASNSTSTFSIVGDVTGSNNGGKTFLFALKDNSIQTIGTTTTQTINSTGAANGAQHYIVGDVSLTDTGSQPTQNNNTYIVGNTTALNFFSARLSAVNELTKINQLSFSVAGNSAELTNVTLVLGANTYTNPTLADGKLVFDTTTPTQLTIAAGANVDMTLSGKISASATPENTIQFSMAAVDVTAVGSVSNQTLVVSGSVTGTTFTFKKGSLVVSIDTGTPTTSEILIGGTDKLEAHFKLAASNVEAMTVQSIVLRENGSATDGTDISNLKLFIGSSTTALAGPITPANHIYSFTGITGLSFTTGETKVIRAKATVPTTANVSKSISFAINSGDVKAHGIVSGSSVSASTSNITATGSGTGTTQALKAGSLHVVSDSTSSPHADFGNYVKIGSTGVKLFAFRVKAESSTGTASLENVTLNSAQLKLNGTVEYYSNFYLYDSANTLLKTISPSTNTLLFDGLSSSITKGSYMDYYVRGDIKATAPANSSISLSVLSAGDIKGTGATSTKSITSTGGASWYTFITQESSLDVTAPAIQIGGTVVSPDTKFKAFEIQLTSGKYEAIKSLQFKITKTGTLTDANLQLALYDGTTKLVDYAVVSGGNLTLAAGASHWIEANTTKTYTIYAYPQVSSGNGDNFTLSVATVGDVSGIGYQSNATVLASGTLTSSQHSVQASGAILSLSPDNPTAAAKKRADPAFEIFRLRITADARNSLNNITLNKLKITPTATGGANLIEGTDWTFEGLYDDTTGGDTLVGTPGGGQWEMGTGNGANDGTLTVPIIIAPSGTLFTRTFYVKIDLTNAGAIAGKQLALTVLPTNVSLKDGGVDVTVTGAAEGNVFTVDPAKVTFFHKNTSIKRTEFLVGNNKVGIPTLGTDAHYVLGYFQIGNDDQEAITINELTFENTGSSRYKTDFDNLSLYVVDDSVDYTRANGALNTVAAGTYLIGDSNAVLLGANDSSWTTTGNPADRYTFKIDMDQLQNGIVVPLTIDPTSVTPNNTVSVVLVGTFPAIGASGRTISMRMDGTSVTGTGNVSNIYSQSLLVDNSNIDSTQLTVLKKLQILPSTNNPGQVKCQVPPTGNPNLPAAMPAFSSFYDYELFIFKVKNNSTEIAKIGTCEIDFTGTLNLAELEKDDAAVGNYPNSRIQLDIPGHLATGAFAIVGDLSGDPTIKNTALDTTNKKIKWILDMNDATLEDGHFTIPPGGEKELTLRVFLKDSAADNRTIAFSILESAWLGKESAGNQEFLWSTSSTVSNSHTTDDVIKLGVGTPAWEDDTIDIHLNGTNVFNFTMANQGLEDFVLGALTVKLNTENTIVGTTADLADLTETAFLELADSDGNAIAVGTPTATYDAANKQWAWDVFADGTEIAAGEYIEAKITVQRYELIWDTAEFDNPAVEPAWWPAEWPQGANWAAATAGTPFAAVQDGGGAPDWTPDFTDFWPKDTIAVYLAPNPTHRFELKITDDLVVGGYTTDGGIDVAVISDNNITSGTYSLSTMEVLLEEP